MPRKEKDDRKGNAHRKAKTKVINLKKALKADKSSKLVAVLVTFIILIRARSILSKGLVLLLGFDNRALLIVRSVTNKAGRGGQEDRTGPKMWNEEDRGEATCALCKEQTK